MSLTALPAEKPSICVCTAPEIPTVHKSLPVALIEGDIAEGGGDLTVVVESILESIVESVVLSVIIVSEKAYTAK